MRVVKTNRSGELTKPEQKAFGGAFSLLQKWKMGGTGSSKIIYQKGISAFDELNKDEEGVISFISFELLKNGLLLRLNRNQRTKCLGILLSELKKVALEAYRIEIIEQGISLNRIEIVQRGVLSVIPKEGESATFEVISSNFKSIKAYFEKPMLKDKFTFSISNNPPEKYFTHSTIP